MAIILRWKNFNYMLAIDIMRNYIPNNVGVLRGDNLRVLRGKNVGVLRGNFGGWGIQKTPRRPAGLDWVTKSPLNLVLQSPSSTDLTMGSSN